MELPSSRFLFGRATVAGIRLNTLDHQIHEVLEQQRQIMRAGARLGVPLKTERRTVRARNSLQRAIEQRAMRGPQVGRQSGFVDRKSMVLGGYQYPTGIDLQNRM